MKKLVIVSGRSGAGKSTALHVLEDLGFYCIDNLPLSMLPEVVAKLAHDNHLDMLALGVDIRTPIADLMQFDDILDQLRQYAQPEVVFLNARDDVLKTRFAATRRKHPLSDRYPTLDAALEAERLLLEPITRQATLHMDTSTLNIHALQHNLSVRMGQGDRMILVLESFGFKYGLPQDADYIFDVRILPNPHWQPHLKEMSGLDTDVQQFFAESDMTERMFNDILNFLEHWLPEFADNHRHYLTIAVGCTGGQHRSVYLVDRLSQLLQAKWPVQTLHREMKHWS